MSGKVNKDTVSDKARYWWAVMYPENMRSDWRSLIGDIVQLPFAYCVHDKDICSEIETRKDHVHLILAFSNTTTYRNAFSVFSALNAPGRSSFNKIERIIDIRHAYDYLIHDTDTCRKQGKYQYESLERIEGNNFDIGAFESIGAAEKELLLKSITEFLTSHHFDNFSVFYTCAVDSLTDINPTVLQELLRANSAFFERLCKGYWFLHHSNTSKADIESN